MLSGGRDLTGESYAAAFLDRDEKGNDEFHQFVLDAVYDKESEHRGEADFITREGNKLRLNLTSSFLRDDDGEGQIGIVVVFTDITETAKLHQQRRESSAVFAVLMICVCVYLFLWSLLRWLDVEPAGWVMNLMIEAIAVVMFIVILKVTSFSIKDIGLRIPKDKIKSTFVPNIIITVVGCVLLVGLKLILLQVYPEFFPEGAPFWDWSVGTFADVIYPFTVVLQEFLTRGVMQENLKRIFTGKYATVLSITVSSLVFGVLHIAYGLPYMVASVILLGALGVLYHKQGNIWGLCIEHYVLGEVATFLRFLI